MSPRRPKLGDGYGTADYTTPAITGHSCAMATAIRTELKLRGLSQREFADLIGATEERVSLVLRCIRRADPATLDRWANALGMRWIVSLVPIDVERPDADVPRTAKTRHSDTS